MSNTEGVKQPVSLLRMRGVLIGFLDSKSSRNRSHSTSYWLGSTYRSRSGIMVPLLLSVLLFTCVPERCLGKVGSDEKEDSSSAGVGESVEDDPELEMTEYLDDEVRFVTEDDFMYEEDRSHYRNFHQGVRGSLHQYERCPPLPQPSAVASSGVCNVKICQKDSECTEDRICCYNGCVSSCLPKVNPPVAFDWVEETDLKYISKDQERISQDGKVGGVGRSPKALLNAEISPESIVLPGGCYLNTKQYEDLIMFRKFEHIKSCSCSKGEVFCEINHEEVVLKG